MLDLMAGAPACADQVGSLCQRVWDSLGIGWLASRADTVVWSAAHILLIVVVALLVRVLAHRAIRRLTRISPDGRLPPLLRTLRERAETHLFGRSLTQRRQQRAQTISSVLRSLVSVIVFTIAIILILGELGINIAPILASAGIVGFAVGFGAQNLIKDFISGIFMMLEDQYGVGDTVDLGAATGTVLAVSFRVTTVRDQGTGDVWYVRNGEITRVGNTSQGADMPPLDHPEDEPEPESGDAVTRDITITGDVRIAGGIVVASAPGAAAPSPEPPMTAAPSATGEPGASEPGAAPPGRTGDTNPSDGTARA